MIIRLLNIVVIVVKISRKSDKLSQIIVAF